MQVIVSASVVQAVVGTPAAHKLHTLLSHACSGRHVISFDPPDCLDAWLQTIDTGTRQAYQDALDLGSREAQSASDAATIKIEQDAAISWADPLAILPLDEALQVLAEKLGFLLENGENDWHFLLGIMPRSQRERIQQAFAKGWLEPLHGGGTTIVAQLQARLAQPTRGLRTAMMFDSDRLHPNELDLNWQPKHIVGSKKSCDAYQWEVLAKQHLPDRYWCLRRRVIESYMPQTELIKALEAEKTSAIEAFSRMANEQRWFYNMKEGFKADAPRKARQLTLYQNLSAVDIAALEDGFGSDLARHYAHALTRDFAWDEAARSEAQTHLAKFLRLL